MLSLVIWEEEDNIAIESNITCVIYINILRKRFTTIKDNSSEVDLYLTSEFSLDERMDAEIVEAEVASDVDDVINDEYEGTFESPRSKKRRGSRDRIEKDDANEALVFLRHQLKVS